MTEMFTPEQKIHYDQFLEIFGNLLKIPWDTGTKVKYQSSADILEKTLPVIYNLPPGEYFSVIDFIQENFPGEDLRSCFNIIFPYFSNMFDLELQDADGTILKGQGYIQQPETFRVFRNDVEVDQSQVFIFTKRNGVLSGHGGLDEKFS